MKKLLITSLLAFALPAALAAPMTFSVATESEKSNVATVESEADLENFTGLTHQITGNLRFDPQARTGSGTLVVNGASLQTGVALRDEHMRSKDWLNFDGQPNITFQISKVQWVKADQYRVSGTLTLNGVTKVLTTEAKVKFTPRNEVTQMIGLKGDALAVTTQFKLKLSDFKVSHPAIQAGRVNNEVTISVKFLASNE